eukprot:7371152-Pyramimonas_sp.AAC.1
MDAAMGYEVAFWLGTGLDGLLKVPERQRMRMLLRRRLRSTACCGLWRGSGRWDVRHDPMEGMGVVRSPKYYSENGAYPNIGID